MKKLGTSQLILLSLGSVIGAAWLFSPYYSVQMAGVGAVFSWLITAILTFIVGISFAETSTLLPLEGGIARFMGITHPRPVSFVFLMLGWLGYLVYLPIEVQSAIQYLGFWFHGLVHVHNQDVSLSLLGLGISIGIMALLTWFNTLFIGKVVKANSYISVWKVLIPLGIAWGLIIFFGDWHNFAYTSSTQKLSLESIFLSIDTNGLVFAFAGFQNGLVLANLAIKPKKALPYSLFITIAVAAFLYISLTLAFLFCVGHKPMNMSLAAPLLALISLFSLHVVLIVIFVDAVIAPFGTANVYTAVTSRVLLGLAHDFLPKSKLTRLNKNASPAFCLWFNFAIGLCFLLPFPTWKNLVDFLSSILVFGYLAGPVSLMVLRQEFPGLPRDFKIKRYKLVGYMGFVSASLFIYWSGLHNLIYLFVLVLLIAVVYALWAEKTLNFYSHLKSNMFLLKYLAFFIVLSYMRKIEVVAFPGDHVGVVAVSILACKAFIAQRMPREKISNNLDNYHEELDKEYSSY